MSSTIEPISQPVIDELKMFNQRFRYMLKSDVFLLNLITCYILKTKGKQLRPTLVMLAAKMFGEIGEKTHTAAALIELLHITSLVHDDVVDEANERRGFFSIHALWNSKTAVLFGDYLLAQGLILSVNNQAFDLLHIVAVAVKEMCEGELLQLEHSRKQNITRDEYFEIIRKKTAALIAACVEAGAQSSGATPEQIARMRQFGIYLGMIFQIKDDLLDYRTAGITGKAAGNDLKEKKYTLPLIYVLEQSLPRERKRIIETVNSEKPFAEKMQLITHLIAEYKGVDHCYAVMDDLGKKAIAMLDTLPQNEASAMLVKAVSYVTKREK